MGGGSFRTFTPGQRITQYHVGELFSAAYQSIATTEKCVSGFRKAGIWPINRDTFTDEDYMAAERLVNRPTEVATPPEQSITDILRELYPPAQARVETAAAVTSAPPTGDMPTVSAPRPEEMPTVSAPRPKEMPSVCTET